MLRRRPLLILAGCVMLFQLANAAMLPLLGGVVTMRSSQWATVLIAACIVVPQIVVALISPWVGRRPSCGAAAPFLLRLRRGADPRRAVCDRADPYLLVAVQLLDGITAAVFTVMMPFMVADIARGTGRFNLRSGIIGTATGIGASLSTTLAGYVSDRLGRPGRLPRPRGHRGVRPACRVGADAGDQAGRKARGVEPMRFGASLVSVRPAPSAAVS